MRRILAGIGIAALLLALSGCLQTETTVHLDRDGSGTIEQRFVMQADILALIVGMGMAGTSSEEPADDEVQDFGFVDENDLRDAANSMGAGVTLESVEPVLEDGFSGYRAVYRFDDINEVRINQNPGEMVPSDNSEGSPEEYIQFKYRNRSLSIVFPQMLDETDIGESAQAETSVDSTMGDDEIEMIQQFYSNLKIGIYIEAESGISSTDATYRDGDTITLVEMDFSKILEDEETFNELIKENPETLEEIKSLIERVPGIKVETQDSVTMKLR